MPIWEFAPYAVLAAAGLFALSLLIPPLADWKYEAAGFGSVSV